MFVTPQPLRSVKAPFDHPDWIFELKYDGFRALARIESGRCQLISRNGNPFSAFAELERAIEKIIPTPALLDGEIVCVDETGHPQFKDLLFRRASPCFFSFDLLSRDGHDLRSAPLVDRKQDLRRLLARRRDPLIYVDHVDARGIALFEQVCALDLEGIVAKHKFAPYGAVKEESTWIKIRNREYSQIKGREELFERDRHKEPAPGWHSCDLACQEVVGFEELEYA